MGWTPVVHDGSLLLAREGQPVRHSAINQYASMTRVKAVLATAGEEFSQSQSWRNAMNAYFAGFTLAVYTAACTGLPHAV